MPYSFLRSVVSQSAEVEPYRVFKLKKSSSGHSNGRMRYICAPHPVLLRTQRWIHNNILRETHVHEASYAYNKGSKIVELAQVHCRCRWMVKLDVTNFFESILEPDVYKVFRRIGYQPLMAFELARICTRLRNEGNPVKLHRSPYKISTYSQTCVGHLPQGAPTSPILANLAMLKLDEDLTQLSKSLDVKYTRYADDLAFSTRSKTFTREDAHSLIHGVYEIMRKHSLWPNRTKTRILTPRARKVVLGLLVDQKRPHLTREFKDRVRMHIYYLKHSKVGPVEHSINRGFDTVLGLQNHVFGLVAFAKGIDSAWGKRQYQELLDVKWPTAPDY